MRVEKIGFSFQALSLFLFFALFTSFCSAAESAGLRPEKIHVADGKKKNVYIGDGQIIGGDRAIELVTINDIRMATNAGFERTVIDLQGNKNGEPAAIERPPYFQIALSAQESYLTFTVWGHPNLDFKSKKVLAAFSKSSIIKKVILLPRIEENLWTFQFELVPGTKMEAFELSHPSRIILDLKREPHRRAG